MSDAANRLLTSFDALPDADKEVVAAEILRRAPPGGGDIPAPALDALADELFASLDAQEAARAGR